MYIFITYTYFWHFNVFQNWYRRCMIHLGDCAWLANLSSIRKECCIEFFAWSNIYLYKLDKRNKKCSVGKSYGLHINKKRRIYNTSHMFVTAFAAFTLYFFLCLQLYISSWIQKYIIRYMIAVQGIEVLFCLYYSFHVWMKILLLCTFRCLWLAKMHLKNYFNYTIGKTFYILKRTIKLV